MIKSAPTSPSTYRPDIDGLRAFAVTIVIGFHAGLKTFFAGGYCGVDVFFVISGYLITQIIDREMDSGHFSLVKFYERRVRRILPALFVMLLAVWLFGAVSLYPSEMKKLNESLIATILSISNIYFYSSINYFSPGDGQALLHTWSLSVEEQFYLLFPLLLLALKRWLPRFMMPVLIMLFLASLIASAIGVYQFHAATFYLLPMRAWELMVGCLLALWKPDFQISRIVREALALTGVLLFAFALVTLGGQIRFPGLRAIAPCLGAALIIFAGTGGTSLVTKALSLRPIVFVGLISYSLYLWHVPVIAFLENESLLFQLHLPIKIVRVATFAMIFVLGYLSWRFVEQPFRNSQNWPAARIFKAAGAASAALLCIGATTLLMNGQVNPGHNARSLQAATFLSYPAEAGFRKGTCFLMQENTLADFDKKACITVNPKQHNVLLVGSSYAAHLYPGLNSTLGTDTNVMQATMGACQPLKGYITDVTCAAVINMAFDRAVSDPRIESVILAARWSHNDLDELEDTLAWLQARGIHTVVVGSPPTFRLALPRLLALSYRDGVDLVPGALEDGAFQLNQQLADVSARHGAKYVSLLTEYCDGKTCNMLTAGGDPMTYDEGHLTRDGSAMVAGKIIPQLTPEPEG